MGGGVYIGGWGVWRETCVYRTPLQGGRNLDLTPPLPTAPNLSHVTPFNTGNKGAEEDCGENTLSVFIGHYESSWTMLG